MPRPYFWAKRDSERLESWKNSTELDYYEERDLRERALQRVHDCTFWESSEALEAAVDKFNDLGSEHGIFQFYHLSVPTDMEILRARRPTGATSGCCLCGKPPRVKEHWFKFDIGTPSYKVFEILCRQCGTGVLHTALSEAGCPFPEQRARADFEESFKESSEDDDSSVQQSGLSEEHEEADEDDSPPEVQAAAADASAYAASGPNAAGASTAKRNRDDAARAGGGPSAAQGLQASDRRALASGVALPEGSGANKKRRTMSAAGGLGPAAAPAAAADSGSSEEPSALMLLATAAAGPSTAAAPVATEAGAVAPAVSAHQQLLLVTQEVGGQFVKLLMFVQLATEGGSIASGVKVVVKRITALTGWVAPEAAAAGAKQPKTQQQVESFLAELTSADAETLTLPKRKVPFKKYSVKQSCFCVLTEGSAEYVKVTSGKQLTWVSRAS